MIVIVLIGILAAIAIPNFFGLIESRRVESATNQVAGDLRLAHSRATNQLVNWEVVFFNGPKIECGGATDADYCLIGANGSEQPRHLPGRTVIDSPGLPASPHGNPQPSGAACGFKFTLRFIPDGTAETVCPTPNLVTASDCPSGPPPEPPVRVRSERGDPDAPKRCLTFSPTTSRIDVD